MLEYDEYRLQLQGLEKNITELRDSLNISGALSEIEKLEAQSGEPGFWDEMENSQKILQKTKQLRDKVER